MLAPSPRAAATVLPFRLLHRRGARLSTYENVANAWWTFQAYQQDGEASCHGCLLVSTSGLNPATSLTVRHEWQAKGWRAKSLNSRNWLEECLNQVVGQHSHQEVADAR